MKKNILFSLIAFLLVASVTSLVIATTGSLDVTVDKAVIKGIELTPGDTANIAGFAGEMVPIQVQFTSNTDITDAKIKMWISSGSEDVEKSTRRIHLVNDSTYSETLSLKLPENIDQTEAYTLYVRIETETEYSEESFKLQLQRESYDLKILDIDLDKTVNAGSTIPIAVVIKNIGFENLDDVFVVASIPELDIEKKAYFSDLVAVDCEDDDCDKEDSAYRTIKLDIPANIKAGVYTVEVRAYNNDVESKVTKKITIVGNEGATEILVPVKSKQINVGEDTTFDLILVNTGKKITAYELIPEVSGSITASVSESIVTVPAGASKTVQITVRASQEGTYNFAVNVNSDNKLVQKVNLSASAVKGRVVSNITALTIVLAIIFVVLLIVLIVLLTKKPSKESFEESYY